jgi:hypothetical protein
MNPACNNGRMQATALGKIAVPTPGTPVQVSATSIKAAKIRFEAALSNAHVTWVGGAGMVGSTLTRVMKQLQIPAAGAPADSIELLTEPGETQLDLSDYWIDANTATEGVLVTFWQR